MTIRSKVPNDNYRKNYDRTFGGGSEDKPIEVDWRDDSPYGCKYAPLCECAEGCAAHKTVDLCRLCGQPWPEDD